MPERQRKTTNLGADVLMQRNVKPEPFTVTTAIESLEPVTKNNRTFYALRYVDSEGELKKVNIFDKKLVEGYDWVRSKECFRCGKKLTTVSAK